MKRFYKVVSHKRDTGGFSILLDGRPVQTPGRRALHVKVEALADALVREWAGQGDTVQPESMPLTQIVCTRMDRVGTERAAMSAAVLKYLNTDLLCYRTDHPPALEARQKERWDPWLDWFGKRFDSVLSTTTDLQALTQPAAAHESVKTHVEALDDDDFTVLQLVTSLSGSLVLGLAFVEREISAPAVMDAARVEERYKAEIYNEAEHGTDPAQAEKDRAILGDLEAAETYLKLLRP